MATVTSRSPGIGRVSQWDLPYVNVSDFPGVDPTGVADSTAGFLAAQGSGNRLLVVKAGTYRLTAFRPKSGVVIVGEGYEATQFIQGDSEEPIFHFLSDVSSGQLNKNGLLKCTLIGNNGASDAPVVICEALTPYVVAFSDFDYHAETVATALEIIVGGANEVYSNKFNIYANGCKATAFKTGGVYNEYKLEAIACASGVMILDASLHSNFFYLVGDGAAQLNGQGCTFHSPVIETIYHTTAPGDAAISLGGYNHTLLSPSVSNVAAAKCPNAFSMSHDHVIVNPTIGGTAYPDYPFVFSGASATTIIGGKSACPNKIEAYTTAEQIARLFHP